MWFTSLWSTRLFKHGLTAGLLLLLCASARAEDYSITAEPAWVEPRQWDAGAAVPTDRISDGIHYLLYDRQLRITPNEDQRYLLVVKRVVNQKGVEAVGQLGIDYDPSYQTLRLHHVRIYRDGEILEQLAPDRITLLQREADLESQIYDGTITASMILNDIRVGDIVAYSYTVDGRNPVFDGQFSAHLSARWSIPVREVSYRLLWGQEQPLNIHNHLTAVEPTVNPEHGITEYIWQFFDTEPLVYDPETPGWYDPYPWIQLEQWQDWHQVAEWARGLYDGAVSDSVRQEAKRIAAQHAGTAERAVAALRFVQDEIRYMGIEVGPGSHQPRPPGVVLEQRFGDCKDKAQLLVALLHNLGIAARPALVDTTRRHTIAGFLATPLAFNHVIVQMTVGGEDYWVDPTDQYQRGDLNHLTQADFGAALLLAPGTRGLVAMTSGSDEKHPGKDVFETFDLRGGMENSVGFTVKTTYRGAGADNMRAYLARKSMQQVAKSYADYYAKRFRGISIEAPLQIDDDERTNTLSVTETYAIPTMAEKEGDSTVVSLFPQDLYDELVEPPAGQRTMPWKLDMVTRRGHTTRVLLPETWPIKPDETVIRGDTIEYAKKVFYDDLTLDIRYDVHAPLKHIKSDVVAAHAQLIDRIDDSLGYELTWTGQLAGERPPEPKPLPLQLTMVLAGILAAAFVAYAYRWEPKVPPLPPEQRHSEYQGLGGWLVLLGFGLILAVLVNGFELVQLARGLQDADGVSAVAASSRSALLVNALVLLEVVASVIMVAFNLLLVVLFFQRRHAFPSVYRRFVVAVIAYVVVDMAAMDLLRPGTVGHSDVVDTARLASGSALWFWYVTVSKRVRSTFVRSRGETIILVATAPSLG